MYLCTPVTLSSTIPRTFLKTLGYFLYTQWVKSPPSSKTLKKKKKIKTPRMKVDDEQSSDRCETHQGFLKWDTILACQPSRLTQRSMHHQKSSSDSPFHANTGTPATKPHPQWRTDGGETQRPASWTFFWLNSDLFEREQQPPHSEWSRCCRRSSGTGPPGPPESRSTPKTGSRRCLRAGEGGRAGERCAVTYSRLGCDVGAAHYVGPCQRFLALGSLPQGDEGRHVCGGTHSVRGVRQDAKVRLHQRGETL